MDLAEFHRDFLETIRVHAEATKDFVRASFIEHCGNSLVDAQELLGFESCRFEGAGGKGPRIDGYWLDETDNTVSLIIGEFQNLEDIQSFITADAKKIFSSVRRFVEEALEGNLTDGSIDESQPGYGLACDLMDWHSKATRYRFYLVSDSLLNTRNKDWSEPDVAGVKAELHIWDINRFYIAYVSATGRDEMVVNFESANGRGLPCLAGAGVEGEYQAYLCMISGDALADIYDQYGSRLLEGNVRTFLNTKGKVNSGIQNTIKTRPHMFFAFNNGIAATAENVVLDDSGGKLSIRAATNFQIVNGGQTTASLAFAKRGGGANKDQVDLSNISVQMKLSVLPPDKAGDLIPDIARFANNQNKVSDADFFSNHAFHIRLEEFSRRLFTPARDGLQHGTHWFYERARGQFANEQAKLSQAQKKQFLLQNPKSQFITKTDVAKYINSWRELPHKVSLGAQKNFTIFADYISKNWATDSRGFNEEYFRTVVALAIIFKRTEELISLQSWYQGGYRANIVTYAIAKLHNLISEEALGRQLNLRHIWDLQSLPVALISQLELISFSVFQVLTDEDRPKDNVTEWAKMQACWDRVKDTPIRFCDGFFELLQDIKSAAEISSKSKRSQRTDDGIELQLKVVDIPGVEWIRMLNWGKKKELLTPRMIDLVTLASHIPRKVPTERQCVEIWRVREQLIEKGYIAF